jgi:hypothetical protein
MQLGEGTGVPNIFAACLQIEQTPSDLQSIREKKVYFEALAKHTFMTRLPASRLGLGVRYLVGCFWINFALVWPEAQSVLSAYANFAQQEYWDVVLCQLTAATEQLKTLPPTVVRLFLSSVVSSLLKMFVFSSSSSSSSSLLLLLLLCFFFFFASSSSSSLLLLLLLCFFFFFASSSSLLLLFRFFFFASSSSSSRPFSFLSLFYSRCLAVWRW